MAADAGFEIFHSEPCLAQAEPAWNWRPRTTHALPLLRDVTSGSVVEIGRDSG